MKRLKSLGRYIVILLLVVGLTASLFLLSGNGVQTASAAEMPAETEEAGEDEQKSELGSLFEGFLSELKAKYGDDYETYLNAILAEWGSVEEYLLSLAGDRDDPASNGWRAFVGWLSENSPIWASALAILLVVVLIVCGRAVVNKLLSWLNNKKQAVFKGMNKVYEAQIAQGQALLKLLGNSPQTEEERAAITASLGHLKEEDGDV